MYLFFSEVMRIEHDLSVKEWGENGENVQIIPSRILAIN